MRVVGQCALLLAFAASGYAALTSLVGGLGRRKHLVRVGTIAAVVSAAALTVSVAILATALLRKDFSFLYVAEYTSTYLPWHYCLSALWVGQAGSLLLWAWFQGLLAVIFGLVARRESSGLKPAALGLIAASVCFLVSSMVFGADPMARNISPAAEGAGLSPLLQHPKMLIHPPVVFLGYALWTIPWAVAMSALLGHSMAPVSNEGDSPSATSLGADWLQLARPWALLGWLVLGAGIFLGAQWSYEELGWGGYWAWDPVENGSLLPWLTGTALLHGLMAWRYRGVMKRTTMILVIATFGLCHFATFLTRSGVFSSLHAFSQSPIGWMFLGLMIAVVVGGGSLLLRLRGALRPDNPIQELLSREGQISLSIWALALLTTTILLGTLSTAVSEYVLGRRIVIGPAYYNAAAVPVGLALILTSSLAPLLGWGRPPTHEQRRMLRAAGLIAFGTVTLAWFSGVQNGWALALAGLAGLAAVTIMGCLWLDIRQSPKRWFGTKLVTTLTLKRRQYSGFLIHLGFVCLAIGIAGSSLGARREELTLVPGQSIAWAGRSLRFLQLHQTQLPNQLIVEAELELSDGGNHAVHLRPAQVWHRLNQEWTTEVDVHSTWGSDFYTVLQGGGTGDGIHISLVENPLIRCLWLGGYIMGAGALLAMWPAGANCGDRRPPAQVTAMPRFLIRSGRSVLQPGHSVRG